MNQSRLAWLLVSVWVLALLSCFGCGKQHHATTESMSDASADGPDAGGMIDAASPDASAWDAAVGSVPDPVRDSGPLGCGSFEPDPTPELVGVPVFTEEPLPGCDFCPRPPMLIGGFGGLLPWRGQYVAVDGTRAVVGSTIGRLGVVDLTNADAPQTVAWRRDVGLPRLISIEGDIAWVVVSTRVHDAQTAPTPNGALQSAALVAIDITALGELPILAEVAMDGEAFSATRRGSIILVETFDDEAGVTRIASFDVSDPTAPVQVDQLAFDHVRNDDLHGRAFAVFGERWLYVVTPRGTYDSPRTRVQIVEASDTAGTLRLDPWQVTIDGWTTTPSQLAEIGDATVVLTGPPPYDALRAAATVTSFEPGGATAPIATLTIDRSSDDASTGPTSIVGTHAYVVETQGSVDAIATTLRIVDVADPSALSEIDSLDLGAVPYYDVNIEPLRDKLLVRSVLDEGASGTDPRLRLTLLDPSTSTVVDEVALAGGHDDGNGFGIVPDSQLVWVSTHERTSCFGKEDTLKVFDSTGDQLTEVASTQLEAEPTALIADTHLLLHGLGEYSVSGGTAVGLLDLDVAEPDPAWASIGDGVQSLAATREKLVRLSNHSRFGARVEVVSLDRADAPSEGHVIVASTDGAPTCPRSAYYVFAHDDTAFVLLNEDLNDGDRDARRLAVIAIDITDTDAPSVVSTTTFPDVRQERPGNEDVLGSTGDAIVAFGYVVGGLPFASWVDIRDPTNLQPGSLELPSVTGGVSDAVLDGTIIAYTRRDIAHDGAVEYWLERIDLRDPSAPEMLDAVSVPGDVVAYDAAAERALTRSWRVASASAASSQACLEAMGTRAYYEQATATCNRIEELLVVVQLDGAEACATAQTQLAGSFQGASNAAFALVDYEGDPESPRREGVTLGRWHDGNLTVRHVDEPDWGVEEVDGPYVVLDKGDRGVRHTRIHDTSAMDDDPVDLILADPSGTARGVMLFAQDNAYVPVSSGVAVVPLR